MAFSFQIIADPSVDPSLVKDANFALSQWSDVLDGKGTLIVDLQVTTGPVAGRADQVLTYAPTGKLDDSRPLFLPSAAFELTTGQHASTLPEGGPADVVIRFDPTYLANAVFVDPNPSDTSASSIPANKTDAVSVIEHEIGHALGFVSSYGLDADSTATLGQRQETTFDPFIQFPNGNPIFTGSSAETANDGNPIPLTHFLPLSDPRSSQNITHIGMSVDDPFINDLMNGVHFVNGFRYTISPLDLAIIDDVTGLTRVAPPPAPEPPPPEPMPAPLPEPPPPPPQMPPQGMEPSTPTAVTRKWIGGTDDNNAGNVANWSPNGAPQPGDTLIVGDSTTIKVSDNDLAGNTLSIDYPPNGGPTPLIEVHNADLKLNATQEVTGGSLTIDASGHDQISFLQPEPMIFTPTINLADKAQVTLTGDNFFFEYFFHGGPGSEIVNNGTLFYNQSGSIIDTGLAGHGVVNVNRAHDGGAMLEVNGKVGQGQTFDLSSNTFSATLLIDQPKVFDGLVDVQPDPINEFDIASVILKGLHATSFDIKDDMLRLFDGKKIVDALRLTNESGEQMTVSQIDGAVGIAFGNLDGSSGMILPIHQSHPDHPV